MKKLIVANWKMYGNATKIQADLTAYLQNNLTNSPNVILALPSPYLGLVHEILQQNENNKISLAAQDVTKFQEPGAYTGEVSAQMLKDVGIDYVIVGHSERRVFFHETVHTLAKKLDAVIREGMVPIFCCGEEKHVRNAGDYLKILEEQLQVLHLVEVPIKEIVIAYEPVWAVGTGVTPTIEAISEVMNLINGFVQNYLPHAKITTLYGGSVNSSNAKKILEIEGNHGVLVGGASLNVNEFSKICSYV